MYIDTATDALLKGLGEQVYSMNVNIIDALISVILVWILVPHMGINGYLVTIYVTEIFNAACSICRLLKISGFRPKIISLFVRPLFAAIGATVIANLLLYFLAAHTSTATTLILHILLVAALYVTLLLLTRTLPVSDIKWLSESFLCTNKKHPGARKQVNEGTQ
jgi:stage V sporulation protein B